MNKKKIFIIDTSAILSGKPIDLSNERMLTTPAVSSELEPGGRDYLNFQFLKEKGLIIQNPSEESKKIINQTINETGDINRLSPTDIEILALALDNKKDTKTETIILTDDYSIQNVANVLKIKFQTISQRGITKKFKWVYRCPGCGKQFKEFVKICPICGKTTKSSIKSIKHLDKL